MAWSLAQPALRDAATNFDHSHSAGIRPEQPRYERASMAQRPAPAACTATTAGPFAGTSSDTALSPPAPPLAFMPSPSGYELAAADGFLDGCGWSRCVKCVGGPCSPTNQK